MEPIKDKKSNGATIGSIIVVIILILGGLYVWTQKKDNLVLPGESTNIDNNSESSAVINAYNELDIIDQELSNSETNFEIDTETIQ